MNSGYIVLLPDGRQGRTFHTDKLIEGKTIVHIETTVKGKAKTEKILCDGRKLKIVGFAD